MAIHVRKHTSTTINNKLGHRRTTGNYVEHRAAPLSEQSRLYDTAPRPAQPTAHSSAQLSSQLSSALSAQLSARLGSVARLSRRPATDKRGDGGGAPVSRSRRCPCRGVAGRGRAAAAPEPAGVAGCFPSRNPRAHRRTAMLRRGGDTPRHRQHAV